MFFKGGQTAKQSENIFRYKANTGKLPIQTWADFKQQFQTQFFPVNTKANVINTLEKVSYYQGNWIVDDYLDGFQTLVSNAGYIDPWTLVVKFQRESKVSQMATY